MSAFERFIWIDIETTGLEVEECELLEIGFRITTPELDLITEKDWVIWPGVDLTEENTDAFIWNMHTKSGLIEDVNNVGQALSDIETDIFEWLKEQEVSREDPLCGSSVQFDRRFFEYNMKDAHELFSYRNVDISTVKELCRRLNPSLYSKIDSDRNTSKRELHRVLPDLQDTCSEAGFYFDNFLYLGD